MNRFLRIVLSQQARTTIVCLAGILLLASAVRFAVPHEETASPIGPREPLWTISLGQPLNLPDPSLTPLAHQNVRSTAAYGQRNRKNANRNPTAHPQTQTIDGTVVDASFGHTVAGAGDVFGDGYACVLVGAFEGGTNRSGTVYLFRGSSNGLISTPVWSYTCPTPSAEFGHQVEGVGDVNNDGYADFIVGATHDTRSNGPPKTGAAYVFYGGPNGPSREPSWFKSGSVPESKTGFTVAAAGDVNGDGYDDVLVGAWDEVEHGEGTNAYKPGRVYLFAGGKDGLSSKPLWSRVGESVGSKFGYSVHGAGDVNHDGYADIIIGSHGYESEFVNSGRVYVYYGGPAGPSTEANWMITGTHANMVTGCSVFTAGDVNHDGFDDIIIGATGATLSRNWEGAALVVLGGRQGLSTNVSWRFLPAHVSFFVGHSVATAGDLNGDGYDDVIFSAADGYQELPGEGVVFVTYGSPKGLHRRFDWSQRGGQPSSRFGATVRSAGDINGDGYDDILIGQPKYNTERLPHAGRLTVIYGGPDPLTGSSAWPKSREKREWLIQTIGFGLGGTLSLLGAIQIFYHRNRQRELARVRFREQIVRDERKRISQDLHDQLGADLTNIVIATDIALKIPDETKDKLIHIQQSANELAKNVAELAWVFKPSNDRLDLLADYLTTMAAKQANSANFACRFDIPTELSQRQIGIDLLHDLVLAVKESIHNAVKHSGGKTVILQVTVRGDELGIRVTDDGKWRVKTDGGIEGRHGNGIANLKDRMSRHGGSVVIDPGDTGTEVSIFVQLPPISNTA